MADQAGAARDAIKTMHLYTSVERVEESLRAIGIQDNDPLKAEDVYPFDSMHYEGYTAVDEAFSRLRLAPDSQALDIGAGFGGPARFFAERGVNGTKTFENHRSFAPHDKCLRYCSGSDRHAGRRAQFGLEIDCQMFYHIV